MNQWEVSIDLLTNHILDQENLVVGHSPVLNIQHTKKNDITIYNSLQKGPVDKYDIYPSNIPDR